MLIAGNADGRVYGMKARTGEVLWSYRLSKLGLNSSPVVEGNFVFAGHSEENISGTEMGAMACVDATKRGDITESGQVWKNDGYEIGYASPAVANGRVYAIDNAANLFCFDGKTGKLNWQYSLGRVGKASPTVTADGVIYIGEQNGVFHILRDAGDRCESLDREEFKRPDLAIDELYGSAANVNGRVYFMTRYNTYCLGKRDAKPETTPLPTLPERTASSTAAKFMMVSPAEVSVAPGGEIPFQVKFFDENGRPTNGDQVEWSLAGAKGAVAADGKLKADAANLFSAGLLTAKSGGLESKARVRVTPKLPFSLDFEAMPVDSAPPGWVGVIRKTKIVERDGSKVLQKLAEDSSAPFMRVKGFMTAALPAGYTIEGDILGTPKAELFRPDMGLINARYELTLMGTNKQLRLESWTPIPRLRHDVPFDWEVNKWYRMKFQVKLDGGKALLRGKVWPREQTEPQAWSIEFTDPYPNLEGSPGVYAFSPGTTPKSKGPEVFFDNLKGTPNE